MTSQPGAIDEDDGAVPVACRLTSAGMAAQNGRWERLAARAMTERSETADGLRLSFRREPGIDDELRQLAEAENQCCPWADWAVQTHTGHIVLEVRSAGDGIGALYRMFTGLPPAPSADRPRGRAAEIEFRDLRYFAAVAEELHFGRAAARLYITQPGLSQAIARLERLLEVRLFTRTRSAVELTEAGAELLGRGRRLLADLDGTVAQVQMAGRGQAGLLRVGVAHLAEPAVAPALAAFQAEHASIVMDRSAMLSERLLEQLAEGRLHAAVIHQVPGLATADQVVSEPLRRGRLAVLAGPHTSIADRAAVTLAELSDQTFLVNPRALAPGAFDGLTLMCREFGGFEAKVLESAAASAMALDAGWRPIRDGTAIAVMAEAAARALRAGGLAVVPVQPPPRYVLALAWRAGEQPPAARRFLTYLRAYRDRHQWITGPQAAPPADDRDPGPATGVS